MTIPMENVGIAAAGLSRVAAWALAFTNPGRARIEDFASEQLVDEGDWRGSAGPMAYRHR